MSRIVCWPQSVDGPIVDGTGHIPAGLPGLVAHVRGPLPHQVEVVVGLTNSQESDQDEKRKLSYHS